MGLFSFIANIETANKLNEKYGLGAANAFLNSQYKLPETSVTEETDYIENEYDYEYELKKSIKKAQFDMSNYLRQTNIPYTDDERKHLNGLIKQAEYIYDEESCNTVLKEWNDICFNKEFIYRVAAPIREIESNVAKELSTKNETDNQDLELLHSNFQKIYDSIDYEKFLENLNETLDFVDTTYKIDINNDSIDSIYSVIDEVCEDWERKAERK